MQTLMIFSLPYIVGVICFLATKCCWTLHFFAIELLKCFFFYYCCPRRAPAACRPVNPLQPQGTCRASRNLRPWCMPWRYFSTYMVVCFRGFLWSATSKTICRCLSIAPISVENVNIVKKQLHFCQKILSNLSKMFWMPNEVIAKVCHKSVIKRLFFFFAFCDIYAVHWLMRIVSYDLEDTR